MKRASERILMTRGEFGEGGAKVLSSPNFLSFFSTISLGGLEIIYTALGPLGVPLDSLIMIYTMSTGNSNGNRIKWRRRNKNAQVCDPLLVHPNLVQPYICYTPFLVNPTFGTPHFWYTHLLVHPTFRTPIFWYTRKYHISQGSI